MKKKMDNAAEEKAEVKAAKPAKPMAGGCCSKGAKPHTAFFTAALKAHKGHGY